MRDVDPRARALADELYRRTPVLNPRVGRWTFDDSPDLDVVMVDLGTEGIQLAFGQLAEGDNIWHGIVCADDRPLMGAQFEAIPGLAPAATPAQTAFGLYRWLAQLIPRIQPQLNVWNDLAPALEAVTAQAPPLLTVPVAGLVTLGVVSDPPIPHIEPDLIWQVDRSAPEHEVDLAGCALTYVACSTISQLADEGRSSYAALLHEISSDLRSYSRDAEDGWPPVEGLPEYEVVFDIDPERTPPVITTHSEGEHPDPGDWIRILAFAWLADWKRLEARGRLSDALEFVADFADTAVPGSIDQAAIGIWYQGHPLLRA